MKVEDYAINTRIGRAEPTGTYEITRRGTRRAVLKYVSRYETNAGTFLPEEWKEKALEAIKEAGELDLLENIKDHCREQCAWLKKEKDVEEYAVQCLCNRAYQYWDDFSTRK